MNKILSYIILLIVGVIFSTGCAKQDIVKKDETISPVTSSKPAVSDNNSDLTTISKANASKDVKQPVSTANTVTNGANEKGNHEIINNEVQLQASLAKIYFDFDSTSLSAAARDLLSKNAMSLKQKSEVNLRIEGHCDERGSEEYNLALGEKRAKVAKNYLVTMGLPAENVSIISYGKEKPANPGHDESAWSQNRRDEFVIIK